MSGVFLAQRVGASSGRLEKWGCALGNEMWSHKKLYFRRGAGLRGDLGASGRLEERSQAAKHLELERVAHSEGWTVTLSSPGQRWLLSPDDCSTISQVSCCDASPSPTPSPFSTGSHQCHIDPREWKTGTQAFVYTCPYQFTIAKKWKKNKCPSADERINQL